jgi:ketosteroid isomerase-like protein
LLVVKQSHKFSPPEKVRYLPNGRFFGFTSFVWSGTPVEFNFHNIEITSGEDVAFATAIGRCRDSSNGEHYQLEFRLTMGFRKHDGRWRIVHEHHSVPATD